MALLTLIHLGPAVISIAVGFYLSHLVTRPRSTAGFVVWLLALLVVSSLVVVACNRTLRRLLPLAVLLRLTLVFPDRAPSRFGSAIRSSSTRDLERRLEEARAGGRHGESLNQAAIRLVELAAMLTAHDRRTRGHCERVRAYADMMAEELRLSADDRNKLRWGALLHDIGKLAVPAAILNKNGAPTAEEWAAIKRHPAEAEQMLSPLKGWLGSWVNAAWEHHERWDGNGYPKGLARRDISVSGRLVAVADSFEVMTAARSYKRPRPAASARHELQLCAGTQFDPDMVRALLNVSIGRLRWEMGPVAWLAQLPFVSWTVPAASSAPAAIATAGRVTAVAGLMQAVGPGMIMSTAVAVSSPSAKTAVSAGQLFAGVSSGPRLTSEEAGPTSPQKRSSSDSTSSSGYSSSRVVSIASPSTPSQPGKGVTQTTVGPTSQVTITSGQTANDPTATTVDQTGGQQQTTPPHKTRDGVTPPAGSSLEAIPPVTVPIRHQPSGSTPSQGRTGHEQPGRNKPSRTAPATSATDREGAGKKR